MLNEKLRGLAPLFGAWRGSGVNHEEQPFTARVAVAPAMAGQYVRLKVDAQVGDLVVHAEETWIYPAGFGELEAIQFSIQGAPVHLLVQQHAQGLVLATPNPEATEELRERVSLQFPAKDGSWRLIYSWGLPGEAIAERSRARLVRDPLDPAA